MILTYPMPLIQSHPSAAARTSRRRSKASVRVAKELAGCGARIPRYWYWFLGSFVENRFRASGFQISKHVATSLFFADGIKM